jgi:hypothetical protein
MVFTAGNELWRLRRPDVGFPPRKFETGEELVESIIEYFEWANDNPIEKDNVGWYEGVATHETTYCIRALTIAGCCAFLGVDKQCWSEWKRERDDLKPALVWAEGIMYEQKFSGAAAGVLNANIIARDLGLAEKTDHSSEDGSMSPKPTVIEFVSPAFTNIDDEG